MGIVRRATASQRRCCSRSCFQSYSRKKAAPDHAVRASGPWSLVHGWREEARTVQAHLGFVDLQGSLVHAEKKARPMKTVQKHMEMYLADIAPVVADHLPTLRDECRPRYVAEGDSQAETSCLREGAGAAVVEVVVEERHMKVARANTHQGQCQWSHSGAEMTGGRMVKAPAHLAAVEDPVDLAEKVGETRQMDAGVVT